jgi:hypothetical protein
VPLRGDIGEDEAARLLLDVAMLSIRWATPLSARLLLLRGKKSGDRTILISARQRGAVTRRDITVAPAR